MNFLCSRCEDFVACFPHTHFRSELGLIFMFKRASTIQEETASLQGTVFLLRLCLLQYIHGVSSNKAALHINPLSICKCVQIQSIKTHIIG